MAWNVLKQIPAEWQEATNRMPAPATAASTTMNELGQQLQQLVPMVGQLIQTTLTAFCTALEQQTAMTMSPSTSLSSYGLLFELTRGAVETLQAWTRSTTTDSVLPLPPPLFTLNHYQSFGILPRLIHILSQPIPTVLSCREDATASATNVASGAVPPSSLSSLARSNRTLLWTHMCQALQRASASTQEDGNDRTAAMQARHVLLEAVVSQGCLVVPLQSVTDEEEWSTALVAMADLFTTLIGEEVEDIVSQPAQPPTLIHTLLFLQNHVVPKVSMSVLEVWLSILDVPTAERHEDWKHGLFRQVVHVLHERLIQWHYDCYYDERGESEYSVDETEVEEFYRLSQDVLVGAYCFLRSDYISLIVNQYGHAQPPAPWWATHRGEGNDSQRWLWAVQEVAWLGLTAPAREINARIKQPRRLRSGSSGEGTTVEADRQQTTQLLLQLLPNVCLQSDSHHSALPEQQAAAQRFCQQTHPRVVVAMVEWLGALAPAWASLCSVSTIWQMVAFCQMATVVVSANTSASLEPIAIHCRRASAKSIRALFIHAASLLRTEASATLASRSMLDEHLKQLMQHALVSNDEETMATVAEGCTRLLVVHDTTTVSNAHDEQQHNADCSMLSSSLVHLMEPILQHGNAALVAIENRTVPEHEGVERLARYLQALQVVIRFADVIGPNDNDNNGVGCTSENAVRNLLTAIWPFLENVSVRAVQYVPVLDKVLAIHEQLLKNAPALLAPYLENTIQYTVNTFERSMQASCLNYMARAVEVYGSSNANAFQELLTHVATITFAHLSAQAGVEECTDLIRGFFELNQRCVLYCPAALLQSKQFQSIVACAVECLVVSKGERESTRETLLFLAQLFGWWTLRLSQEVQAVLQQASTAIDEQLAQHGERIVHSCMATLLGGPPMLWPACSDCLFAVLSPAAHWAVPEHPPPSNMARQWMEAAKPRVSSTATWSAHQQHNDSIYDQVVAIFLGLTGQGPKSKPKAKMLLSDYGRVWKGEMAADALVSYSLT